MAYRFVVKHSRPFFTLKKPHYCLAAAGCLLWAFLILEIWHALVAR